MHGRDSDGIPRVAVLAIFGRRIIALIEVVVVVATAALSHGCGYPFACVRARCQGYRCITTGKKESDKTKIRLLQNIAVEHVEHTRSNSLDLSVKSSARAFLCVLGATNISGEYRTSIMTAGILCGNMTTIY